MAIIKGQNLRLIVGNKVIAASTSCTLNISAALETTSTKDSTGSWEEQECTSKSWDVSADALFVIDQTETGFVAADVLSQIGTSVAVEIQNTNGDQNRTKVSTIYKGNAIVSSFSASMQNKANATYSIQLQGTGELTNS